MKVLLVSAHTPRAFGRILRTTLVIPPGALTHSLHHSFDPQVLATLVVLGAARPEIPSDRYGPPPPAKQYGPPAALKPYPPAQQPQQQYGAPPPQLQYGPPPSKSQQLLVTKNVYVHVPPPEQTEFVPSRVIDVPVPKKHYKIIFIKAPTAPTPTVPVIPEQPQDIHKTLVYVLVKKPEEAAPVELPVAEPTEPSKPEVFFIKYKEPVKEPVQAYGPPPQVGPY